MRTSISATLILFALAASSLVGCSDGASGKSARQAAPPAVPVTISEVVEKDAPIQVTAIANVQAYATVSMKSQIAGQIVGVHFREGQNVKKGDLLFTIDPRPLEAMLRQAQANVARDTAQLRQTEAALAEPPRVRS